MDDHTCYIKTTFDKHKLLHIYKCFGLEDIAAQNNGYIRIPTGYMNQRGVPYVYNFHPEELFLYFMTRMKTGNIILTQMCNDIFVGARSAGHWHGDGYCFILTNATRILLDIRDCSVLWTSSPDSTMQSSNKCSNPMCMMRTNTTTPTRKLVALPSSHSIFLASLTALLIDLIDHSLALLREITKEPDRSQNTQPLREHSTHRFQEAARDKSGDRVLAQWN